MSYILALLKQVAWSPLPSNLSGHIASVLGAIVVLTTWWFSGFFVAFVLVGVWLAVLVGSTAWVTGPNIFVWILGDYTHLSAWKNVAEFACRMVFLCYALWEVWDKWGPWPVALLILAFLLLIVWPLVVVGTESIPPCRDDIESYFQDEPEQSTRRKPERAEPE